MREMKGVVIYLSSSNMINKLTVSIKNLYYARKNVLKVF